MRDFDPIRLEIAEHRFAGIAEEMGEALVRSSVSPNIKERRDLSCAVFDADGGLVAHAAHIPVHLGAMPSSVAHVLADRRLGPGDVVIVNDPYRGGTHLPDITLVAPVFIPGDGDRPSFHVANRAHHADVGGMVAGSMPVSDDIHQEGVVIPPVHLVRSGEMVPDVARLILANVRNPAEREWDLRAQAAVLDLASSRLIDLAGELGAESVRSSARDLIRYAELMTRAAIRELPDGRGVACGVLEPIAGTTPTIHVAVTVGGDSITVDFTGTTPVVRGPINAVRAVTLSAVCYVLRCLLREPAPANAGILRPLTLRTEPGSLVDATFPAAVAAGNVETSQRIVDVVLRALADLAPERIPAASSGTMMNIALGGLGVDGRPMTYYETVAGGAGAAPWSHGASGIQTHMTNTMNTPAEAIAHELPLRVRRYGVRRGSGGAGRFTGGDGIERVLEARTPLELSLLAERATTAPYGLAGGADGAPAAVRIERRDGVIETLSPRAKVTLEPGDRLWVATPGGGGHGPPPDAAHGTPPPAEHGSPPDAAPGRTPDAEHRPTPDAERRT